MKKAMQSKKRGCKKAVDRDAVKAARGSVWAAQLAHDNLDHLAMILEFGGQADASLDAERLRNAMSVIKTLMRPWM
jgi:hypothetical protein